ncbi:MAG: TonB-dependent receptor [candidate division KSB1 bacterium]|nr:TonB-dependent receptor [candidate division KSB1 bacterium]MDZ7318682.1 TonB-dependent receptor [candidate division KSB1 bacterium]MDZ7339949.1 TonB-dependent receptor [candidate division KSB1 bacterium]
MKKISIFISLSLLILVPMAFAGITGKIAGHISDAESGQPLPGVNVFVEGTSVGATTDLKGDYVILNVPPGVYTLKATMMGYASVSTQNVIVKIDLTTTISFKMKPEALEMSEVVVVAERPVVTRDVAASEINIDFKKVETLPVKQVNEVLVLQAGIEQGSEGVIIRGGGARQTAFMVDGLSLNDERSNVPFTALSLNSIQEMKIQTAGFNAEYGNIRSGVVNVVTREGDRRHYNGGLTIQYRPPAKKNFGPSIYDPYTYFTRPYMDPAVCWTGTTNGAWDAYTQRQYPIFEGWIAVSDATIRDNDPKNDLTPEGAKKLWEWQHRRRGDINKPDYVVDGIFGGPIPVIGPALGDLRFTLSHFQEREMFIYPLSRDNYLDNSTQLKLTSDINPMIKLLVTGLYSEVFSVSPYDWTTTPTGRVLRYNSEVADLISSSSGDAILYMPGYYSPSNIYRTMLGFKWTHMLSAKTFYEINLQHNINRYKTYQMALRDTTKKYEPVPGIFTDEAPWGYWGYGVTGIDGMILGGWMNLGRDKSVIATTKLQANFTSQLNNVNQVKAGVEIVYDDYNIKSYTENPGMTTWNRQQVYHRFPYRVGAYVQDKLEFEGFIANVGLRLDYSDPNGVVYQMAAYDKYFREGFGKLIEVSIPTEDAKPTWHLSPRLGISHPITINSKLYFNYGHFTQEPSSTYRFRLQREYNGLVTTIGNPNMVFEKTVAYELGYAQNLFDLFLLNLAAYYKDITNQPGWVYYENINASVQYSKAANNNYEDIRGFELTLTKTTGRWLTGFINYTYDVGTSGYFGLLRYYEDPNKQRNYIRENPYQEKPRPQPYARFNFDIHTPPDFGPVWLGQHVLGNWYLNLLASWRAGAYATYNPHNIPGVVDNVRWRDNYNFDMRLTKSFKLARYELQAYLDITNVFNLKFLNYAGFANNYDYLDYMESLHFSWESGSEHGHDRIGDYRKPGVKYEAYDPSDPTKTKEDLKRILDTKAYIDMPNLTYFTFLNPRDIKFGLKISF